MQDKQKIYKLPRKENFKMIKNGAQRIEDLMNRIDSRVNVFFQNNNSPKLDDLLQKKTERILAEELGIVIEQIIRNIVKEEIHSTFKKELEEIESV